MISKNGTAETVYVVDDDEDLCKSIVWTLKGLGYDVQGFTTPTELLLETDVSGPCCAVIDLLLPGTTGLKLCQELAGRRPSCTFVMISGHGDLPTAVEAMKLGAIDFLEKPCSRQQLVDAVQRALELAARRYVDLREEQEVVERLSSLTARERDVFSAMAAGLVTKEIASQKGISAKTVDVHRSKIMKKLRIDSPTQLARVLSVEDRFKRRNGTERFLRN